MFSQLGLKLQQIEDGPVNWSGDDEQYFHLAADTDEMEIDSGRGRSLTTEGADTLRSGNQMNLKSEKFENGFVAHTIECKTYF